MRSFGLTIIMLGILFSFHANAFGCITNENPPYPSFTFEDQPCMGTAFTFDGSVSCDFDPGDSIALYEWSVNGVVVQPASSNHLFSHDFSSRGPHQVTLEVWDNGIPQLSDTLTRTVYVGDPSLATCYVANPDFGNNTTGDGSEGSPFATIQYAIDRVCNNATVYVIPDDEVYSGVGNYNISFRGKEITVANAALYNNQGEHVLWNDYSGDVTIDCDQAGYGFSFFKSDGTLDGITIINGYGCGAAGGLETFWCSPTIKNCTIKYCQNLNYNYAGGVRTYIGSPTFINCRIQQNSNISSMQAGGAGGVLISCSTPEFINCLITDNTAAYSGGGVRILSSSNPTFTYCTIANNQVPGVGGGIYCYSESTTRLNQCILWGNTANEGGDDGDEIYIATSLGSMIFNYSDIRGGLGGAYFGGYPEVATTDYENSNIDADPDFYHIDEVDPDENDYHITFDSPCIDMCPVSSPLVNKDIEGNGRPEDILGTSANTYDAGCYEAVPFILSLEFSGVGTITVDGTSHSDPIIINSIPGETVTLTATAGSGYVFDHWEDENGNLVPGAETIDVLMDGDKTRRACFVVTTHTLTVDVIGDGEVTNNDETPPNNIITARKQYVYNYGAIVDLTLSSLASEYNFIRWEDENGVSLGTNSTLCQVNMDGDKQVRAILKIKEYLLTDNTPVNGAIAINPDVPGRLYLHGSTVALTAVPDEGYVFNEWTVNGVNYQANPLSLYMDEAKEVWATFETKRELNLTVVGGTSSIPIGKTYYPDGDEVIVQVTPLVGYGDVDWDVSGITPGDYQINGNTCTVTMNADYTLAATCDELVSNIIYVSPDGDNSDGLSWQTAFNHLQDALDIAVSGEHIWVAEGTYYPDEDDFDNDGDGNPDHDHADNDPSETFQLISGITLYGGFEGYETSIDQRKPGINQTILSGDIQQDDGDGLTGSNNAYHVVIGADNVLLDGFMIVRGCANNTSGGGGLLTSSVTMTIQNCHFFCNNAQHDNYGGALYNSGSLLLINCIFSGNTCSTDGVAAQYGNGGAIYNDGAGTLNLINCTLSDNLAESGAGIYNANTTTDPVPVTVENCILWNNIKSDETINQDDQIFPTVSSCLVNYSCIQGLTNPLNNTPHIGNIGDNPLFVEPGSWVGLGVPDSITLDATIRDFQGWYTDDSRTIEAASPPGHKDFERSTTRVETGIVGLLGSSLGDDGKPVYAHGQDGTTSPTTHGQFWFDMWYRDTDDFNLKRQITMTLTKRSDVIYDTIYEFRDTEYFPIDGELFDEGIEPPYPYTTGGDNPVYHNFHFTTEAHTTFYWDGDAEYFEVFGSDDDLFIYLNGYLVIDIGGVHSKIYRRMEIYSDGTVWSRVPKDDDQTSEDYYENLANWEDAEQIIMPILETEKTYSFDLFFAERRTVASHLQFNTSLKFDSTFTPGDYHLLPGSPCIDWGYNGALLNLETPETDDEIISIDLDGNTRRIDDYATECRDEEIEPVVDMGAYEYGVDEYEFDIYAGEDKTETVDFDVASTVTVPLWDAELMSPYANQNDYPSTTLEWTVERDPVVGTIQFSDTSTHTSAIQNPDVTLDLTGFESIFETVDYVDFILKFTADDMVESGSDLVRILVYKDGFTQRRPQVTLDGPYVVEMADLPLTMTGTITDDGEPVGGLGAYWDVADVSAGGTATFIPPSYLAIPSDRLDDGSIAMDISSEVTFTQPGSYLIQLVADDGDLTGDAFTTVQVIRDNNPPTVDAGTYLDIIPGIYPYVLDLQNDPCVSVSPSCVDEGLLEPVKLSWRVISGPINGMLYDTKNPLSKLTFSKTGTYVLQLVADDGQYTVTDQATIRLLRVPQIEAGENKNAVFETGGVTITMSDAWVRDNYFANEGDPEDLTIEWSVLQPPGDNTVDFDPSTPGIIDSTSSLEKPAVNFLAVGEYQLQLSATDGILNSDPEYTISDTVKITITEPVLPSAAALYAGGSQKSPSGNGALVYRKYPDGDWAAISPELDDAVLSLCVFNGVLYAGTMASSGEAHIHKWDRDAGWPSVNSNGWGATRVYALAVYNGSLFAGTDVPDVLFKYDGEYWEPISVTGHTSGIRSLYVWDNRLYLDANKKGDIDYYDFQGYHPQIP